MALDKTSDVLVVGAGPVGMTAALLLTQRGVDTTVIDAKGGPAARSYACALHPQSLELFDRLGLAEEILQLGRRFGTMAFYEGTERRAEIKLSALSRKFPFLLVLPQNQLESLLERALNRHAGIPVHWHHQLSDLKEDVKGVVAAVDRLAGSSTGYIVPHWEMMVKETVEIGATFVVGADGHHSLVRQRIGLDYVQAGEPELFTVFEFETEEALEDEVRVVLDASTTNVLWPLPGGRCRWSFQEKRANAASEFPEKARRSVWIEDPETNKRVQNSLQGLFRERAPWFSAKVKQFDWVGHVQFERQLVKLFGNEQCRLIGDAAHQTGPVGVQSFNVGLREADSLAETLKSLLEKGEKRNAFDLWEQQWRGEWEQLLGIKGPLKSNDTTDKWVAQHAARILPCVPASGDDLIICLSQVHLSLP